MDVSVGMSSGGVSAKVCLGGWECVLVGARGVETEVYVWVDLSVRGWLGDLL